MIPSGRARGERRAQPTPDSRDRSASLDPVARARSWTALAETVCLGFLAGLGLLWQLVCFVRRSRNLGSLGFLFPTASGGRRKYEAFAFFGCAGGLWRRAGGLR